MAAEGIRPVWLAGHEKRALLRDPLDTGFDDDDNGYDDGKDTAQSVSPRSRRRLGTMIMMGLGLIVCLLTLIILLNPLMTPKDGPNPHELAHSHDNGMHMDGDDHHYDGDAKPFSAVSEDDQKGDEQQQADAAPSTTAPSMSIQTAHPGAQASLPTANSDLQDRYILDPDWDFSAEPTRREYTWTIRDQNWNPDGIYRVMTLVNYEFPGPLIEVNEGDTIVVHVDNQAKNATSMHWHGLFQNGTNYMDGTVGVTNCPIAPGSTFTYEFTVTDQSGTYWWHSHQSAQASDGLFGPLVIHGRQERELQEIQYDTDRIVMVSDHYHDPSSLLLMKYLASDRENIEPVPNTALINGQGFVDCSEYGHRFCDNTTANVARPVFNLEAGKSHRLRFINTGAFAEFQLAIDEHDFSVTEVDGTDVHPQSYNRLTINPAQRYSVIVNATNDSERSYWFRAKMLTGCFGEDSDELESEIHAIVRYISGPETNSKEVPDSREWSDQVPQECRDMNTTDLVPVVAVRAPERSDATFYIRSNFEIGGWRLSRGFFNETSWRADVKNPSLLRTIDGLSSGNETFVAADEQQAFVNSNAFDNNTEFVIQTNGIQVIDLLIENFDDGNHPIHLHGYKFWQMASGHGYPPANLSETVDVTNPLRRDTSSVEAFGWVLLRLVADNPGMWALHCHVAWHMEAGLMMQLLTRADEVSKMQVPEDVRALCDAPREELEKGAGPMDEVFMSVSETGQTNY